ncbi:MAG: diaminopimelate decarboxylase [Planctomycetia bacterium]|nr:MAG: diaminopimelate decarboxylase [Planctomycetia bacterium]
MDLFEYRNGALCAEAADVARIADDHGTPLYIYSANTLREHYRRFAAAFAELRPLVCFSVKSCQNIHILRLLREAGSGFDVVSGGELERALAAGADPARIVYAGVGKTDAEIRAALKAGIHVFNVESESELIETAALAGAVGVRPTLALRVNPDVDAETHEYTTTGRKETKFGVDLEVARDVFRRFAADPRVSLSGLHLHLGSPVLSPQAYRVALERVLELVDALRRDGVAVDTLDAGGGFGAHYRGDEAPSAARYAEVIVPLLRGRGLHVILEPGRSIAANAGILVTRVLHVKMSGSKRFVIVDGSMTDLIRPALYGAAHFAWPVQAGAHLPPSRDADAVTGFEPCDIVGPVCESGDFLARDRRIPPVRRGDLIALYTTGAYGMSMSSQYNSRPRAAEVLVDGSAVRLIRRRETMDDLLAPERV